MIDKTMQTIDAAIVEAVKRRVQELAETELKQTTERMQTRIAELAAGIALNMSREISTKTFEDHIVITVRLTDVK